ncbi:uridine kinase [Paracoccidioides brasiliensis Pb18]|uniref:Uridine kinase n=1 Tax=Paracoccidioides brasiliensis (strain Pb18) TaxID=502780 RepID=A0A0A0HTF5_PARBD|nr:uridine kinase [Paracoccidioides brasiliensis Pb18]KGM91947.1 uridine kinase [Paracoccidioides brasiliensis Pb18]
MSEHRARYSPPWADMTIIGIAGGSGSGKTSVAMEIINCLNLPWVVILVMDSFYKTLTPEQNAIAHNNEYDFDCPDAIDFDILVDTLQSLKKGRKVEIPIYSFERHQRQKETISLYSPHVVILEGILAFTDQRVVDMLDIFVEADMDVCLGRRILRDVRERGRTIDGVIKQWFKFVKPSYLRYVEPQRHISDIIIPRGIENKTAIESDLVVKHIQRNLREKSEAHNLELQKLGKLVEEQPLSSNVLCDEADSAIRRALDTTPFVPATVTTPQKQIYHGLRPAGTISAVAILRGGSCLETGLKKTIPDCITGRILIQTNYRTGEPELHYLKLPHGINTHASVLLLDPQMSSGGAALMAVRVLVDHGVEEGRIIFVTFAAGQRGLQRLTAVYPDIKVVVGRIEDEGEERWIEKRYFGC